jgi:NADPH-dependent 7-cyano-7-deazaguanine reductase QueF-like protein
MIPGKINAMLFILVMCCFHIDGQSQTPKNFCVGKEYAVVRFYKNDTIKVECDTVYLVNTSTFKLYDNVFSNQRSLNGDVKRLSLFFDQSKALYENRIKQQAEEYAALKTDFDLLLNKSTQFSTETTKQLSSLNTSLNNINQSVVNANKSMDEARELIKTEMRQSRFQKVKCGVGDL